MVVVEVPVVVSVAGLVYVLRFVLVGGAVFVVGLVPVVVLVVVAVLVLIVVVVLVLVGSPVVEVIPVDELDELVTGFEGSTTSVVDVDELETAVGDELVEGVLVVLEVVTVVEAVGLELAELVVDEELKNVGVEDVVKLDDV
jgi:hypothetical protein